MDLKALREDKLKMSQEELAKMLAVSLNDIKDYEANKKAISLIIVEKIAVKTGLDFNSIMNYKKAKPKPIDIKKTWGNADFTKNSIVGYIDDKLNKIDITEDQKRSYIDDLKTGVEAILVKPTISIVGRSDTGKSTLINALIGMDSMPTSWTPTTSIAVYIKHVNDRPSFIKDDMWVFADHSGDEKIWNSKRLYDRDYCEKWKIASGGINTLKNFGTRQGNDSKKPAGSAVVFLNAPILCNCDIIDLPGFGTGNTEGTKEDEITFETAQRADILIYLSQAAQFLHGGDITYLSENLRSLPVLECKGKNNLKPLSNLFIVASQAHNVNHGNQNDLKMILQKGCKRLCDSFSDNRWNDRINKSGYREYNTALVERFFTYTTDIPDLCSRFNEELKTVLETIPDIKNEKAKEFIREYAKNKKPDLTKEIQKYEVAIKKRDELVKLLNQIDSNELKRSHDNTLEREKIKDKIDELSHSSISEFTNYYSKNLNVDKIVTMLKNSKIKNKKDDIEAFASRLQDGLQTECNSILKKDSSRLADETKKFVEKYNESINAASVNSSIEIDFNAGYSFASALSKIGIIGGLGAYIAGEAIWALGSTAFILGIGGDIALAAGAFGPIGIAVGLLVGSVLGLVKLFGGGWQKNVAKKIVASYEDNDVLDKYVKNIKEYWHKTKDAFNKAADALDEEWYKYVENLRKTVNTYNIDEIENNIITLKNIMFFFDNIPL